jgi:hypothetical protein
MVLNGVLYENGASSSSCSGGMVGMVDFAAAEFEIAFVCKVGFRDEHDVNVVVSDECFQLSSTCWVRPLAFHRARRRK